MTYVLQLNNANATKSSQSSRLDHPTAIPTSEKKKSAAEQTSAPNLEPEKKEKKSKKKDKSVEKSKSQDKELDEAEKLSLPLLPSPPQQHVPSSNHTAFREWYLAKLADNFEAEIEGLNDADASVGSKVLIQALESNLTLFSSQERNVALATQD